MPQRSTPFQAIVHLVRSQSAQPGVTVTESRMLHDPHLGIDREVDIVIEGTFDGDAVVTSIEVIEHSRPASVTWVEQQIAKHRYLPTNRLILVSKSGFTKMALVAVAAEGGNVEAIRLEMNDAAGDVETLYMDRIQLTPTLRELEVTHPVDGLPLRAEALPGIGVFESDGTEVGTAFQLAVEALGAQAVLKLVLDEVHNHPDRNDLITFSCGVPIETLGYHLRSEPSGELLIIRGVHFKGEFHFDQAAMPFADGELGNRRFGSGEGSLFGRPGVWVRTIDETTQQTTIGWRITDDLSSPSYTGSKDPQFKRLDQIVLPPQIDPEVDKPFKLMSEWS